MAEDSTASGAKPNTLFGITGVIPNFLTGLSVSYGKPKLIESGIAVKNITIIMLCRNNEKYLPYFFSMMSKIEADYDCKFFYVFLENGSTDNTPALLREFIDRSNGYVLTHGNGRYLASLQRTVRLAQLRNFAARSAAQIDSNWTMLVDSDVYFDHRVLETLFSKSPTRHNIGMLCAFGVEGWRNEANTGWVHQSHYFDTSAFRTKDKRASYFPNCIFRGCQKCAAANAGVERLPDTGVVEVSSAFGGLAIVRTDLIRNNAILWQSSVKDGHFLCEHVAFCEALTSQSNLSVAIDCDTRAIWDVSTYAPH